MKPERKFLRHWFPTFRQYPDRRGARPSAYDFMISNDSWLAAHLTDTTVGKRVRDMVPGFDIVEDMPMAGAWQRTFEGILATINKRAWEANVNHYWSKISC
jgi:hypothetical protein